MKWTIERIIDLKGKVIVVTGGNSGLGYESVKAFAMKGADVVLTSRSTEKGEEAKAPIHMEWFAAMGLIITLVWLYIEILRLLSILYSRD